MASGTASHGRESNISTSHDPAACGGRLEMTLWVSGLMVDGSSVARSLSVALSFQLYLVQAISCFSEAPEVLYRFP